MSATQIVGATVHPLGCVCAFPILAPNLPERQDELRRRMRTERTQAEKDRQQGRINQLCGASDWHATLIILTSPPFNRDGRVWQHVDLDKGLIHFPRILRDYTFSGGQRRMIEIAASLFNREHRVNLHYVLGGLDYSNQEVVQRAIRAYLGVR